MLTQSELKSQLNYDSETGIFTWKISKSGIKNINQIAGNVDIYGYHRIKINQKIYKAHRLAWLYIYGEMPKNKIDHINRIKNDNRICNLREATISQNGFNQNLNKRNTSGFRNVSWNKRNKKWIVALRCNKKQIFIGTFDDVDLANQAAIKARNIYFGVFSNDGE